MKALHSVRNGIFFLMLSMGVNLFATGMYTVAGVLAGASGDFDRALDFISYGSLSLLVGTAAGFLGKLFCLSYPEAGIRRIILAAVVFELIGILLEALSLEWPWSRLGAYSNVLGWVLLLSFLSRVGDQIDRPDVRSLVTWLYRSIFAIIALSFLLFFFPVAVLALVALLGFGTVCLYGLTLYRVFQGLLPYIKKVESGEIDPGEKAEDRRHRQRLQKLEEAKKRASAPSSASETPQGPPPEGSDLYRIPKKLPELHQAVKDGDPTKVETLLAQGEDPSEKIKGGLGALHLAACGGVMEVANLLISRGVPVDQTADHKLTPLYFAIQTGNTNLVGFLIARGASLQHRNEQGLTPLHWVCSVPHPMLVPPTRIKIAELLLEKGADPQAITAKGATPRQLAQEQKLEELGRSLDRTMGIAPTPIAQAATTEDEVQIVITSIEPAGEQYSSLSEATAREFEDRELLEIPRDLSPYLQAVKEGDPDKVELQLDEDAELQESLPDGRNALHLTAVTGVMAVANLLIQKGLKVDTPSSSGPSPLFFAVAVNNLNLVGFLLARRASINLQDDRGRTPLHWACASDHSQMDDYSRKKMIDFLLDNGADPALGDSEGMTPAQLAVAFGRPEIAVHLEEKVHDMSCPVIDDSEDEEEE